MLKEHFKAQFNIYYKVVNPIEFKDASSFIRQLQDISNTKENTTPPETEEHKWTIKSLKQDISVNDVPSAYVKHATECKEFILEVVKTIRRTNKNTDQLGSLRISCIMEKKRYSKGKLNDLKSYRGLKIDAALHKILVILIIDCLKN